MEFDESKIGCGGKGGIVMTRRFLIQMEGGLEPTVRGPYATEAGRDWAARDIHRKMDEDDNLIAVDIHQVGPDDNHPVIKAYAFSGGFFEEE
jgi:hypothetical protein